MNPGGICLSRLLVLSILWRGVFCGSPLQLHSSVIFIGTDFSASFNHYVVKTYFTLHMRRFIKNLKISVKSKKRNVSD